MFVLISLIGFLLFVSRVVIVEIIDIDGARGEICLEEVRGGWVVRFVNLSVGLYNEYVAYYCFYLG